MGGCGDGVGESNRLEDVVAGVNGVRWHDVPARAGHGALNIYVVVVGSVVSVHGADQGNAAGDLESISGVSEDVAKFGGGAMLLPPSFEALLGAAGMVVGQSSVEGRRQRAGRRGGCPGSHSGMESTGV